MPVTTPLRAGHARRVTAPEILHGPGDLIAALPGLLGYSPRESVVIVGVGPAEELTIILRVDRADLLRADAAAGLARSVAAGLVRSGARLAVIVAFTDADVRLACPAIDALRPALEGAVDEAEGWAVRRGRFFAPGCARESCCPSVGRVVPPAPVALATRPRVRAEAHGRLASAPDAAYAANEAARRRVARAGDRWWAHREQDGAAWRSASFAAWRAALQEVSLDRVPSDPDSGRLVAALRDRKVRDAVLVSLLPGWENLAPRVLEGSGEEQVARALRVLLAPGEGRPPERDTVEPVWDLCGWLTARARADRRAPMLTLCAVIAWWEGDEPACRDLLRRAHASEPGYRLAGLLECTVLAGIDPGWRRAA
jgi:hypothetical protein